MSITNSLTSIPSIASLEGLPDDTHRKMLSHLDRQSTRAFSRTCKRFYWLMQREITQRQLLTSHFPFFKPLQDINGALAISASQSYQRLSVAYSMKPLAVCLETLFLKEKSDHKQLQFTPDRKKYFSNHNNLIKLWDAETNQCLRSFCNIYSAMHLQITPDERRALSVSIDFTLKLWDLRTGQCLRTLIGHNDYVTCLQITPDGRRALSGSRDNTLKLWDLRTGQCLQTLIGHNDDVTCLQITTDGRRALSESKDTTLKLWDLDTGQCLQTLIGHNDDVTCLQITPDGRRALSGSKDTTLKLWDLETGQCLQTLVGHKESIKLLKITSDGTKAISACATTLKLWNLETDQCPQIFSSTERLIQCLQITPDGTKVLTGSNPSALDECATLTLFDLQTGRTLWYRSVGTSEINCLQITPDGKKALWGGSTPFLSELSNGILCFLDLETGKHQQSLLRHKGPCIKYLQITFDGTRALSGTHDGHLKLWDLCPLPEERISAVAQCFISDPTYAPKAFALLPQFVQNEIIAIRPNIIRARISSKAESYSFPCMGRLIKKCVRPLGSFADRLNIYEITDINAESLNVYNAIHVALPSIRMCFLRAIEEKPILLVDESIQRVANLPLSIKTTVYRKLYEIHLAKEAVPQPTPPDYGESAFLSKQRCSIEERIKAITRAIEDFKTRLSGSRAISQLSVTSQPLGS